MQKQNQPLSLERRINANRSYIYTENCVICGQTENYAKAATALKSLGKDVYAKQTPLFIGWQQEAAEIGLPMPFVYDCDTEQYETVENIEKMSEQELKAWLGIDDGK